MLQLCNIWAKILLFLLSLLFFLRLSETPLLIYFWGLFESVSTAYLKVFSKEMYFWILEERSNAAVIIWKTELQWHNILDRKIPRLGSFSAKIRLITQPEHFNNQNAPFPACRLTNVLLNFIFWSSQMKLAGWEWHAAYEDLFVYTKQICVPFRLAISLGTAKSEFWE